MSAMQPPEARQLQKEPDARGASMGDAALEGVRGFGTLQVVRDRQGRRVAMEGTWRPADPDANVAPLVTAAGADRTMRYEGPVDDPRASGRPDTAVDVRITSHADYPFTEAPDGEHAPGGTRHVFNFQPDDTEQLPVD
ncbi:MAG: hypothetical protein U5K81_04395 [Trueperaceae bacterium]|nr:hypothetical protein [Trueperaceae bacterium]